MKVLTLLGGPRKKGNTAAILEAFEQLVGKEHQVERINITDYHVAGCLGCDGCQPSGPQAKSSRNGHQLDEPGCCQRDDGVRLLKRIMESDLAVYACPLYSWSYPAQMKALIDRQYCLVKSCPGMPTARLAEGKRAALLVTCGGALADNADLIEVMFRRQIEYTRGDYAGTYIVDNCSTPAELEARLQEISRRMARDLLGL